MLKRLLLSSGLALCIAGPVASFDLENMTEAERQAFRDEVRAYLMDNPEVLIEAINVLEQRKAEAAAMSDADIIAANAKAIFEDGHSYVGGNPDGDITIVEFLDYRCGFCKKSHPEVAELLAQDGNIRFVIKEFPILGEESLMASRFAMSVRAIAGDDAYMAVHNTLMEDNGRISEARLRRIANSAGLDADAVIEGMGDPSIDAAIQKNYQLAQIMQISGTPSFVFGDVMLRGYAPLAEMRAIVEEQRGG